MITWLTGNSGAGKTTLANKMRRHEILLDGDAMRAVWPGLGFTKADRWKNNLRIARLAKELDRQGFDIIVSTICPYRKLREEVRHITGCRFIYIEGGRTGKQYPYEK